VLLRCKNVKVASGRGPGTRAGLTRDRVLAAALDLVDEEGLAALSMRRLGARLDVEAMTLYHHVPNKDALLDGLVEVVLRGAADVPDDDWRSALRGYAHRLRATLLAHPAVLPLAVSRSASTPESLRVAERMLRRLRAAGFALGPALDLFNALSVFVLGHAAAETGVPPTATGPGSTGELAGLDPAEFPLLVEAATTGAGTDDAARFGSAVDALIEGFALGLTR
jgi:AcrR family transcriptional regulator